MRPIGIFFHAYRDLDTKTRISLMKKHGFTATFTLSEDPHLPEIMCELLKAGITCESMHAPFSGINAMWCEGEEGENMLARLLAGVDACATYGVPVLVVHLSSGKNPPHICDTGVARYARLMAYAKEKGVLIAYENQRMRGNLGYAFDLFPDAVFCWDTGHEECFTAGARFMPMYGHLLAAIHVHDNHCEPNGDEHMLPFDGKIDFVRVAKTLRDAHYAKSVMLEVENRHPMYRDVSPDEYYARAAAAAKKLAERIDSAEM